MTHKTIRNMPANKYVLEGEWKFSYMKQYRLNFAVSA